jgi:hypothetical protein
MCGERLQHLLHRPIARPALQPSVAGLVRRETLGHIAPARSGSEDPQDPVEYCAILAPRPAFAVGSSLRLRQQRLQDRPLVVRQFFAAWHVQNIRRRLST